MVQAELQDAIKSLRRPNRDVVGKDMAEAAERRATTSLSQLRSKETKHPIPAFAEHTYTYVYMYCGCESACANVRNYRRIQETDAAPAVPADQHRQGDASGRAVPGRVRAGRPQPADCLPVGRGAHALYRGSSPAAAAVVRVHDPVLGTAEAYPRHRVRWRWRWPACRQRRRGVVPGGPSHGLQTAPRKPLGAEPGGRGPRRRPEANPTPNSAEPHRGHARPPGGLATCRLFRCRLCRHRHHDGRQRR